MLQHTLSSEVRPKLINRRRSKFVYDCQLNLSIFYPVQAHLSR